MRPEDGLAAEIAALVYRQFGVRPDPMGAVADVELSAAERELGASLPHSYRTYLRHFGSQTLPGRCLFGLPRDRLWGDIVLMNDLDGRDRPPHYLKFSEDGEGRSYYFDTRRAGDDGECPVVVRGRTGEEAEVAPTFLEFLACATAGVPAGFPTA